MQPSDPADERQLMDLLLAQEGFDETSERIPTGRRPADLPLSFAQQRLWVLDRLEPGSPLYNMGGVVRLRGQLERGALERALEEIVRRHETLRTTFNLRGVEGPFQLLSPPTSPQPDVIDLRTLAREAREGEARRLATEELQRPFRLETGPLLRARLLQLDDQDHLLVLSMHHIISDGWSVGVLIQELARLYAAIAEGREPELPPLPLQYADFAIWERERLGEEALTRQLTWWKEHLASAPAFLELPLVRPRPAVQTFVGRTLKVTLPGSLADAVEALARAQGATPFMVLFTAFNALLARYTGQKDVVVGTSTAGRDRTELEGLIGLFVNTLALRTRMEDDPPFVELLQRVRRTTLDAYAHQDLPFDRVVEAVQPTRDLSRNPLFQVMFDLLNLPRASLELPGMTLSVEEPDTGTAKFDLSVTAERTGRGLELELEFNTDLFDEGIIARLARHYQRLLEVAVAEPRRRLSALPLLAEEELRQQVVEWNRTERSWPRLRTFQELFEEQVARAPSAVAVSDGVRTLSHAGLDARAERIARALRARGVGPEHIVAVLHERDADYLAAMIGILKAGAAYVPLDPVLPQQRLEVLVAQCRCSVVLTQAAHLERARALCPEGSLLVAEPPPGPEARDATASPATLQHLAYVLFTSGSTGNPKGAMLTHEGLTNHILAMAERMAFTAEDCMAQTARQSFDVSVWQFLATLHVGGRISVFPDECARDPVAFLRRLVSERVSICEIVPSLLGLVLDELERRPGEYDLSRLRWLIVTGEAFPAEACRRWFALHPRIPLLNAYGPTECSDDVTCHVITAPPPERYAGSMPIHGTLPNFQVYVLDERLDPLPVGVPGELFIGGLGVGRGYLADPERTAAAFLPDPFTSQPGARLYRTGDRVRYREDGSIEFLGRVDHQVKIRGARVEIGEIENTLGRHARVGECVVVARELAPGDKRLVAYVVPRGGEAAPSSRELREHLRQHLPPQVVPSAFVVLEALPLLPSGKVNRQALPPPPTADGIREAEYVAPATATEQTVAGIWAKVLGIERVGARDDFFELGGHSLLATQVLVRLRERFEREVPLRAFFEEPTVAGLAGRIDAALGARPVGTLPPLKAQERPPRLPLSFAQQRLWIIDQLEPGLAAYNIPVSVRLSGPLDVQALHQALRETVRRHEVLRTSFVTVDATPVQVISPVVDLPLPLVDLRTLPVAEREARGRALAQEDGEKPFSLESGPLLRASLVRLAEQEHLLLLCVHHIVADGWSMGILLEEVGARYGALAAGRASPPPGLPVQYADYTLWQRGWLRGEVLEAQLAYWREQLAQPLPILELATDRPRPPAPTYRGALVPFSFPSTLARAAHEVSQREGVTPFMLLLAVFQLLLHRYTGQVDMVVGSPIANRRVRELEELIGFFANTLALRTHLDGNPTFRELLGRVREVALGAYAHQDVPFELLVEELRPGRDLSRHPIFQAMFVLQNTPFSAMEQAGLTLRELPVEITSAKFDLVLTFDVATERELSGTLEYSADLFEGETARRMVRHLQQLLEGVLADPTTRLLDAPLLAADERRRILEEWNATGIDNGHGQCLHTLFEAQVARTPDALALEHAGQRLSYRELNARANQLGRLLRRWGVGPDTLVGLCVDRSIDAAVGILGILKAGGAYVPLDPTYPAERLAFMISDTRAPVLLTQSQHRGVLPAESRTLCLDTQWELAAGEDTSELEPLAGADHLGYVIYTSGSTGRPKGVSLPHRALTNLLRWHMDTLIRGARTMQFASLSFDASIHEMFGAWCTGGAVFIIPEDQRRDTRALASFLREHAVEKVILPVVTLQQLAEEYEHEPSVLGALREVMATGEQLQVTQPIIRLFQKLGRCTLHNHYGPSESHVVTAYTLTEPPETWKAHPSIGRPIANTRIHLLDRLMQPVPVGVVGELYIAGVCLARGYFDRPELTAEKFIPDPFATRPGERLYRTGDLARYLPDGTIEFLGRMDDQVKIRGFRIELGEVEAALLKHPAIHEAVVVARREGGAGPRLVAYVVCGPVQRPGVGELRRALLARLPEYMVPSAFVFLEALPLTPNRKVDRRALPEPEQLRPVLEQPFVAPGTAAERVVAGVWARLLGVSSVGLHDNFFELGGHSLLGTQLVARLREIFRVELRLRVLFEAPTVGGLVEGLAQLWGGRDTVEEIAALYEEMEGLSEEEVRALLREG